nr:hypothetical protein [uncultured Cohaesibacter sp.]
MSDHPCEASAGPHWTASMGGNEHACHGLALSRTQLLSIAVP